MEVKTKYDIHETLYFEHNGDLFKGMPFKIEIVQDANKPLSILYYFDLNYQSQVWIEECKVYNSKEGLLNSLEIVECYEQ